MREGGNLAHAHAVIRCRAGNVSTANAWELGDAQGTVGKRSASSLEGRTKAAQATKGRHGNLGRKPGESPRSAPPGTRPSLQRTSDHAAGGPAATRTRRRPAPAPAHHPPSPWVPWPPSSPPQLLALRPSPPQPFNRSSSTGGVLTHLAEPHRLLVTAARIPIHHLAAAIINPASKVWCRSARGMAASRRRSSYAGNCCLPMQLYDERRKPAPGLAF